MENNFACKMLWNPWNCYANLMLLIGTLAPTTGIFSLPLSSRGIKEPSLDMFFFLRGCILVGCSMAAIEALVLIGRHLVVWLARICTSC